MDEAQKKEFTVGGFTFGNKEDVELAEQEISAVKFIDKKIEGRNAETIKSVYQAALEKRLFRTPVGYTYLYDLQRKRIGMGISKEDIPGVPLYQVFNSNLDDKPKPERTVRIRKKKDELHRKNARLTIAVLVLAFLVVVLFAISMTGSSPTVLNYRRTVQNEYAEWEQQLKDREAAVREKERELNGGMYESN